MPPVRLVIAFVADVRWLIAKGKKQEADGVANMQQLLEKTICNRASTVMQVARGLQIQRGRGSSKWWPAMGGCLP
jgi:uncharacterized membrane protein